MKKRTVESVDVFNKRVLLRADFNSPVENGKIVDDTRITSTLPTITYLLDRGAKLIICSHQGRPDGKYVEQYSLKPIAEHLRGLVNKSIKMAPDCVGGQVSSMVGSLMPGEALVLENLRLHHRGHDTPAFLTVPGLRLYPGERIYLDGQNGCGKSSLLKAVAGLWPYGQ
ncbi:MAG TPA: phosphoglycerate kinase, partial [Caldisericia bacterium]|nr:phosphoglycerate kinase [Caldisericia bacterium]